MVTLAESRDSSKTEDYYYASQWKLMGLRLRQHRLAMVGLAILIAIYLVALFAPFLAPYAPDKYFDNYVLVSPQRPRFFDENGFSLRPFVYGLKSSRDPITFERVFTIDPQTRHYLQFFVRGCPYKLFGLFKTDLHLFGVAEPGVLFLFGTDTLGRDLFSRNMFASRISLSVGLVGVAISFFLGCLIGGISGYFGGPVDMLIQRVIEFMISIPTIPLWMALSAALPDTWSQLKVYFAITVILALQGWCGLARVVRGKLISTRKHEFVTASKIAGASEMRIIVRHLLPSFLSYLVVNLTLAIPSMILGETSLSFLGLGLRPPTVSWGVLLSQAQNVRTVAMHPWLLLPGFFVVVIVLAFNFFGDGLRDAADPYKGV